MDPSSMPLTEGQACGNVDQGPSEEALLALYEENAKTAATFWEWRHKIMMFYVAGAGALVVSAGWLCEQELGTLLYVPLALGTFLAVVSFCLDRRNVQILGECFRVANDLERRLGYKEGTVFGYIERSHQGSVWKRKTSYTTVLGVMYVTFGLLFASGMVYIRIYAVCLHSNVVGP